MTRDWHIRAARETLLSAKALHQSGVYLSVETVAAILEPPGDPYIPAPRNLGEIYISGVRQLGLERERDAMQAEIDRLRAALERYEPILRGCRNNVEE